MKYLFTILLSLLISAGAFSQAGDSRGQVEVRYYPNPATTQISFEFPGIPARGTTLEIFSLLGRKTYAAAISSSRTNVDLSNMNKGLYVFQFKDSKGNIIATNKFQVNK